MASRGINKVILVGNVGNDPECREGNSGAIANLSIATSETWKDKNTGEQQERTEWHRVVFFNRLAEVVRDYVKKGTKVYLEGRLQTRSYRNEKATAHPCQSSTDLEAQGASSQDALQAKRSHPGPG